MKLKLTAIGKALLREYKDKHFDWIIRMGVNALKSMDAQIKYIQFPPNYCLEYRDSDMIEYANLSAAASKLRIELKSVRTVLGGILDQAQSHMDDDMRIAGALRLLEQVEIYFASSEKVRHDILVDPQAFMAGLSTCIKLLKFHLELFTVSDRELE